MDRTTELTHSVAWQLHDALQTNCGGVLSWPIAAVVQRPKGKGWLLRLGTAVVGMACTPELPHGTKSWDMSFAIRGTLARLLIKEYIPHEIDVEIGVFDPNRKKGKRSYRRWETFCTA